MGNRLRGPPEGPHLPFEVLSSPVSVVRGYRPASGICAKCARVWRPVSSRNPFAIPVASVLGVRVSSLGGPHGPRLPAGSRICEVRAHQLAVSRTPQASRTAFAAPVGVRAKPLGFSLVGPRSPRLPGCFAHLVKLRPHPARRESGRRNASHSIRARGVRAQPFTGRFLVGGQRGRSLPGLRAFGELRPHPARRESGSAAPAEQHSPPRGRARLTFEFLLRGSTSPDAAGRFGHMLKCARIRLQ